MSDLFNILETLSQDPTENAGLSTLLNKTEQTKADPNHFNNWFPLLKQNPDNLFTPKSAVYSVDADAFVMLIEDKSPTDQQQDDFNEVMHQFAMNEGFSYPIFIKTAITSNKFHFWNCVIMGKHQWAVKARSIFQAVLMHGAPLSAEIILRELVPTTTQFSIYSGMPLTFEYRIFIDADKKIIEKSINYWDLKSMASGMSQSEDDLRTLMTFFSMFGEEYDQGRPVAEEVVKNALEQGYFDNLSGKWSVDIMLDYKNRHWLIDMAESEKSWGYY